MVAETRGSSSGRDAGCERMVVAGTDACAVEGPLKRQGDRSAPSLLEAGADMTCVRGAICRALTICPEALSSATAENGAWAEDGN